MSTLERKKRLQEIEALSPVDQGEVPQDLRDRIWIDIHIEAMLGFEEAYEDGVISPGQFIGAVRAHLRKLRRAYPMMDS